MNSPRDLPVYMDPGYPAGVTANDVDGRREPVNPVVEPDEDELQEYEEVREEAKRREPVKVEGRANAD